LLFDVAGQAYVIDMLAPQFPDVNFIIPHLGSFADDWRVHQQVVDQLVRFPNVYGDTSSVRRFDYIVQAVKRAGPHKVLFGSDGPWLHPGVDIHKIRLLGLPQHKEALILGSNALRLLRQVRVERGERITQIERAGSARQRCLDHPVAGHLPPPVQVEYEL
jgi:hypothetical protein